MYRLIYKSKSLVEIDQQTVKDILQHSQETNQKDGISGALLATRSHFLQVLEGEFEAVNHTFVRIVTDPRHEKIQLIHFGPIDKLLFEGWVMRGFGLFDLNLELEKRLKVKYGEEEGGIKFPIEEWSSLSLMHDIKLM
jgi:hypothetical protein